MAGRFRATIDIPADEPRVVAIISPQRLVLVSVLLHGHDENYAGSSALAGSMARDLWCAEEFASAADGQRALAEMATLALERGEANKVMSFTLVELARNSARIWNCGGHRVIAISPDGAVSSAAEDGFADRFYDSPDPRLRTLVKVAAVAPLPVHLAARGKSPARSPALVAPLGPAETCGTAQYSGVSSKPRGPTIAARERADFCHGLLDAVRYATVDLQEVRLLLVSPRGELPFVPGVERCVTVGEVAERFAEVHALGRRCPLVGVERGGSTPQGEQAEGC